MTIVENKKIDVVIKAIIKGEKTIFPHTLVYSDLIIQCVERPKDEKLGYEYEEIKAIGRIEKTIERCKEKDNIEFEDSDFNVIKEKLKTMRWRFANVEFIDFTDYINSLKSV